MEVISIPCLRDNYAWLLVVHDGCVVVDPSEAGPVEAAIAAARVPLRAILATHHHPDHVGGIEALVEAHGVPVYGHVHDEDRIPRLSRPLSHGDRFDLHGGLAFEALHVPGHTLGAVTYVGHGWAFTGDTLFTAGCGRLFEGTAAQMHASLNGVLGALPDDTWIACGHEYTASNLRFAAHVEPDQPAILARIAHVAALRQEGKPSVPARLGEERATNPFLRVDVPAVRAHFGLGAGPTGAEVFAALRAEKDSFQ